GAEAGGDAERRQPRVRAHRAVAAALGVADARGLPAQRRIEERRQAVLAQHRLYRLSNRGPFDARAARGIGVAPLDGVAGAEIRFEGTVDEAAIEDLAERFYRRVLGVRQVVGEV